MTKDAVVLLDDNDDKDIDELEDEAVGPGVRDQASMRAFQSNSLDGPESCPRLAKVCGPETRVRASHQAQVASLTLVQETEWARIDIEQALVLGVEVPSPFAQLGPSVDFGLFAVDDTPKSPGEPEREGQNDESGNREEDKGHVDRVAAHAGSVAKVEGLVEFSSGSQWRKIGFVLTSCEVRVRDGPIVVRKDQGTDRQFRQGQVDARAPKRDQDPPPARVSPGLTVCLDAVSVKPFANIKCTMRTARLGTPPSAREAHELVQRGESDERENQKKDEGFAQCRDEVEREECWNGNKDGAEDACRRFGVARRGEQGRAGGGDEQGDDPARQSSERSQFTKAQGIASTQTHCIRSRSPSSVVKLMPLLLPAAPKIPFPTILSTV